MKVEVVYALADRVDVVSVSVPPGATLRDAVVASGLGQRHPQISLEKQAFGIFGRRVSPETRLAPGDRIEVYRALAMDPKEARRRRAAKKN
jgi:putative ubiquitin-RnfH superfamily antitoxin RatB of RatAB toxin-antitoxin module